MEIKVICEPVVTAPRDGTEVLLTDGVFTISAFWDEVDYSEFWDRSYCDWNYGPAEIDPSNWQPTHWIRMPEFELKEQE